MEVVVYGGAFNPPTKAHQAITSACLELPDVDEVWLMPCGVRKDKYFCLFDSDRPQMLEVMKEEIFNNNPRLKVSSFEMDYDRPTQTYKTVDRLAKKYPNTNFRFVFGADSHADMPNWQEGARLQKTLGMLIVPRSGIEVPKANNIQLLQVADVGVMSSTEVRNRVEMGQEISGLVCKGVADYIQKRALYHVK